MTFEELVHVLSKYEVSGEYEVDQKKITGQAAYQLSVYDDDCGETTLAKQPDAMSFVKDNLDNIMAFALVTPEGVQAVTRRNYAGHELVEGRVSIFQGTQPDYHLRL